MVFVKALCVVFLWYSASFGESRNLKNDSNWEKRMISTNTAVDVKDVKKTATIIETWFRKISKVEGT
jgi:hypothetical protein